MKFCVFRRSGTKDGDAVYVNPANVFSVYKQGQNTVIESLVSSDGRAPYSIGVEGDPEEIVAQLEHALS